MQGGQSMIFIMGCCVGSFLCACAFRYNQNDLKKYKRSVCPFCRTALNWFDLIPVISWLMLRGKCRTCKKDIPLDHLLCEVLTGFLFVLLVYTTEFPESAILMLIYAIVIYAAMCDYYHGLIPDRTHVLLILLFMMMQAEKASESFIFSGAVFVVLFFMANLSQGMGMGDVKMIASMSLFLTPYSTLCMLFIASFCALVHVMPSFLSGKHKKRDKIRFAPYLSFGFCAVMMIRSCLNG